MTITHTGMLNEYNLNALIVSTASLPITADTERLMNMAWVKLTASSMF